MSTRAPKVPAVDLDDIQGILRFGFKHHREACFLLLRVKDAAAARRWLAQAPVTSAVTADPPPRTVLQIAFTGEGLSALGVPPEILNGLSEELISGMAGDENRSRRLGDLDANQPSHWDWGRPDRLPHLILLLYALPGLLEGWQREIESQTAAGFEGLMRLTTNGMQAEEHFGFADGISEPDLDWGRTRPIEDRERLQYGGLTCLGEILLGYPNEYGLFTDRPLLDPLLDPHQVLPRAEDRPDLADLGRNGSYLVMRQLSQDVPAFWQYLKHQAGDDMARAQGLAEAMVGRRLSGVPLAAPELDPQAGADINAFTYDADPEGLRCPLGAHVRRANPRTADLPPGKPGLLSRLKRTLGFDQAALAADLVASTRFHRLLRRGRSYGERLTLDQALTKPVGGTEAGLHFICLVANIGRQFEFTQSAWIQGTRFNGLGGEGDPLLGHRQPDPGDRPTDRFSIPRADGPDQRLCGLPRFVTLRGGAYFFLPGIRALRFIASFE